MQTRFTPRLEAVREIKEGMGLHSPKIEELATRKMRAENPELASDWDAMREAARRHELLMRRSRRHQQSQSPGAARGSHSPWACQPGPHAKTNPATRRTGFSSIAISGGEAPPRPGGIITSIVTKRRCREPGSIAEPGDALRPQSTIASSDDEIHRHLQRGPQS